MSCTVINTFRWVLLSVLIAFVSFSWRWDSVYLVPWPLMLAGWAVTVASSWYLSRWTWWLRTLNAFLGWWLARNRVVLAAVAVFAAAALCGRFVLDAIPHVHDSFTYWFQARIFAAGACTVPVPALPEFFRTAWMVAHAGKWFGVFPPGWPALLSLGFKAHAPLLVNPLLGALALLAIYGLAIELYGKSKARAACLLVVLSPFFIFMNSEFMAHTSFLLFSSLFAWLLVKGLRRDRAGLWLLAGLAMGAGILIRPMPALCITAAWAGLLLWRERNLRIIMILAVAGAGMAVGVTVYLVYNHHVVGEWLVSPLSLTAAQNRMGFGPDIGFNWNTFDTPGHTPWRGLVNLNFTMAVLNNDLFGWPLPSLLFLFSLVVFGRKRWADYLCFTVIGAVTLGYFCYWYHGVVYGARFYFCLLPYLAMATVEGLWQFPAFLQEQVRSLARRVSVRDFTRTLAAVLCVCTLCIYFPKACLLLYDNHLGVDRGLYRFVAEQQVRQAIVFVAADNPLHYEPGFIANALDLSAGDIIYARDLGEENNQRLCALYPDRAVYHYTYVRAQGRIKAWVKRLVRHG
jgi:4-amino-4-deoxy-L-arabinose transferase-like glycosyltransferase